MYQDQPMSAIPVMFTLSAVKVNNMFVLDSTCQNCSHGKRQAYLSAYIHIKTH